MKKYLYPSLSLGLSCFLLGLCGCKTTEPRPVRIVSSPSLSIRPHSRNLRQGTRAALVAFNSIVYSDRRPRIRTLADSRRSNDTVLRITAPELRTLTDAMLLDFIDNLQKVKGLSLLSIKEVATNPLYQRLNYPRGDLVRGFSLVAGNGRRVAPRGLRYIPVPHSVAETGKGLFFFGGIFANFSRRFQADMQALAKSLDVDFVIIVNNQVRLTARFDQRWGGELQLFEMVIIGRESGKKYIFARYAKGPFSHSANDEKPPIPAPKSWQLAALNEAQFKSAPDFSKNKFWQTFDSGYDSVVRKFCDKLNKIRQ